jgi:hypothetical protein
MHDDFFMDLDFFYMLALCKRYERDLVNLNRFLLGFLIVAPCTSFAASDASFNMAAQLLSAARNGNTRLVQNLINSGADVNYIDSTGVSVVCTAIMNNDIRAVQVLQMYGADASQCDRQIKNYRARNNPTADTGLFSGLSSSHKLLLSVAGTGAVIAGLLWATDAFEDDNGNSSSSSNSGGHTSGGSGSGGSGSGLNAALTVPYGPAMVTTTGAVSDLYNYDESLDLYSNDGFADAFNFMNVNGNYLLMMHGYSPFARGYMGQTTLRYANNNNLPVPSSVYGAMQLSDAEVSGGIPINVALITSNGINAADNTSLADRFFLWSKVNGTSVLNASNTMISSKYFNNSVTLGSGESGDTKVADDTVTEITSFDLSGNNTAIHNTSATDDDNLLAKIVGGYTSGNFDGDADSENPGDFVGFLPNGQMTIYRTGGASMPYYYNYTALNDAATKSVINSSTDLQNVFADYGRAKVSVIANLDVIEPLYNVGSKTVADIVSLSSADYENNFYNWVAGAYGNGDTTTVTQNSLKQSVQSFFTGLGTNYFPITVFSVGGVETDSEYSGQSKYATVENAAPLIFTGANKLFMSVVAVNLQAGSTASASSISGFTPNTTYRLSQWQSGTVANPEYYKSRICGIAGAGTSTVDPWCFAAAGKNDEQATAAAAGAAGSVKAAFSYMDNKTVFTLLALTADGAYLGTNPSDGKAWGTTVETATAALGAYLSSMYSLPTDYQTYVDNGTMSYLDAFKQVFGYGLINLERATTPGKSIYYYTDGKIVSSAGNAYWRAAANSKARMSNVFGARAATVPVSFYDVVTAADNSISVPRVWNMELSLGTDVSHGLYLGDTLAELKTHDVDNTVAVGNFKFGLARSEKYYDDNMGGIDDLSVEYNNDRFGFVSNYQHYLTDGMGRFSGNANPVLSLVSNAVSTGAEFKSGRFAIMGRGFVGEITNDDLLENDPVISNNFAAAKLGDVMGAESGLRFNGEKLSLATNVGNMRESGTVLGGQFVGLLGGADTNYVDATLKYNIAPDVDFSLRGTFALTDTNGASNGIINGISELKSNAYAANVRFKNFDLTVSAPLALIDGHLNYSHADFIVDDNNNLQIKNAGEYAIDLTPEKREYRFNASYRHKFGDWTDGALGFIYRVHPNNTDAFGNESIFMMKLSHRLGI